MGIIPWVITFYPKCLQRATAMWNDFRRNGYLKKSLPNYTFKNESGQKRSFVIVYVARG